MIWNCNSKLFFIFFIELHCFVFGVANATIDESVVSLIFLPLSLSSLFYFFVCFINWIFICKQFNYTDVMECFFACNEEKRSVWACIRNLIAILINFNAFKSQNFKDIKSREHIKFQKNIFLLQKKMSIKFATNNAEYNWINPGFGLKLRSFSVFFSVHN